MWKTKIGKIMAANHYNQAKDEPTCTQVSGMKKEDGARSYGPPRSVHPAPVLRKFAALARVEALRQ